MILNRDFYSEIDSSSTPISSICSGIRGCVVEPLDIAAVLPDANLTSTIDFDERTSTMLLSIKPLSFVDTAILPLEDALALPLVADKLTLVLLSIGPHEQSLSMHFILVPVSTVGFAIGPDVFAIS